MAVRRSLVRAWRRFRRPTLARLVWASIALHVVVALGFFVMDVARVRASRTTVTGAADRRVASGRVRDSARPARDSAAEDRALLAPRPRRRAQRRPLPGPPPRRHRRLWRRRLSPRHPRRRRRPRRRRPRLRRLRRRRRHPRRQWLRARPSPRRPRRLRPRPPRPRPPHRPLPRRRRRRRLRPPGRRNPQPGAGATARSAPAAPAEPPSTSWAGTGQRFSLLTPELQVPPPLPPSGRGGSQAEGTGAGESGSSSEGQIAVPLNTQDPRYAEYFAELKRRIEDKWTYPSEASRKGQSGGGEVRFVLHKNGSVRTVQIVHSSGVQILDSYIENAIRMAQPFPPIPAVGRGRRAPDQHQLQLHPRRLRAFGLR